MVQFNSIHIFPPSIDIDVICHSWSSTWISVDFILPWPSHHCLEQSPYPHHRMAPSPPRCQRYKHLYFRFAATVFLFYDFSRIPVYGFLLLLSCPFQPYFCITTIFALFLKNWNSYIWVSLKEVQKTRKCSLNPHKMPMRMFIELTPLCRWGFPCPRRQTAEMLSLVSEM